MSCDDGGITQHVSQYVLYENDFTEVRSTDGSCIQLSPCGTTFICQQPLSADSHHPVDGIGDVKTFLHALYVICLVMHVEVFDFEVFNYFAKSLKNV